MNPTIPATPARLDIPRLRNFPVTIDVLPTDEFVNSIDVAIAIRRALRSVPEIQAWRRGRVTDPRFPFPDGGLGANSLHEWRITDGSGHGLMSEQDAADALGVTKRTVQRWAVAGTIGSTRHRGERRIPREAVAALVEARS